VDGSIYAAFYLTPIVDPLERSYGCRQDTCTVPLTHYPLLDPKDANSKSKAYWAGAIGGRMREGWRVGYTDGAGINGMAASAVYSEDWTGFEETYGAFLGPLSTVADAERRALALGASNETTDMLFLLTDSLTALQTAINLRSAQPPRSGIEIQLKGKEGPGHQPHQHPGQRESR